MGALLLAGIQGPKANPFLGAESVRRAEAAAAAAAQPWIIGGWVMIGLAIVAVLMYIAAAPRPKPSS